ncbi:MAG: hypothetical protein ACLTDR_09250 [Adlercreutzia equolifaciens]
MKDPRGFIAGWIIALGPVWVYTAAVPHRVRGDGARVLPVSAGRLAPVRSGRVLRRRRRPERVGHAHRVLGGSHFGQHLELLDRAPVRQPHHRFGEGEGAHARAHGQAPTTSSSAMAGSRSSSRGSCRFSAPSRRSSPVPDI